MPEAHERSDWPAAWFVGVYFAVYWAYLWVRPETELLHWLSLVLLPVVALRLLDRNPTAGFGIRELLRRLGLHWPRGGRGMALALLLMVLVQAVQMMNASLRSELVDVLASPSALWMLPAAFALMVVTAGFTEEFFFRGIVQRSITSRLDSHMIGIAVATIAFSLYHVPYAYLNPAWPSAGDLGHAIGLAFLNGTMGGLILGVVFVRSGSSLVPCILVHAAVNWLPAVKMLTEMRFS